MPATDEIELIAHLLRRAGFGTNRDQLEAYLAKGYDATVEELLHPEEQPPFDEDFLFRYYPYFRIGTAIPSHQSLWMLRMTSTKRPLEEKMTLFWHHVLATAFSKVDNAPEMGQQLDLFRSHGMGNFEKLLQEVARDPAMIFWLDNCENHRGAPNENFGRELLELFSMGVGMDGVENYTEDDVKACANAFTGWTIAPCYPRYPYGEFPRTFEYQSEDHDDSEKVFLGQRGHFNGEDIIAIISKQPATARFISRHLYNFFVADEPQVATWKNTPPQDLEAIELMEQEYFRSGHDIGSVLRVLFTSDCFKNSCFTKIKSPAELIAGVMRMVDDYTSAKPNIHEIAAACGYMGQELLNPPTVEGWHTGREWIDSGALVERINFASDQVGDAGKPGVKRILERLAAKGPVMSPEALVDSCLDVAGPVPVSSARRKKLIAHIQIAGEVRCGSPEELEVFGQRVTRLLQLIVSSREFQFA